MQDLIPQFVVLGADACAGSETGVPGALHTLAERGRERSEIVGTRWAVGLKSTDS